jgi:hypothetical protein
MERGGAILQPPQAHAGFLQGLESVTEYKSWTSTGLPAEKFKHADEEDIRGRTLDWAVKAVVNVYNIEKEGDDPFSLGDLTRYVAHAVTDKVKKHGNYTPMTRREI